MAASRQDLPEVMTADQVAAYLHVSGTMIRRLARRGEIPHFQIGTLYRFHRRDVEEMMRCRERRQDSRQPPSPDCTADDGARHGGIRPDLSDEQWRQRLLQAERLVSNGLPPSTGRRSGQ